MRCPGCQSSDNDTIRTAKGSNADRRRLKCSNCGGRWNSTSGVDAGSFEGPRQIAIGSLMPVDKSVDNSIDFGCLNDANSACLNDGNSASVYLISDPDQNSDPDQTRAKSKNGAEFSRLLGVYAARWERSYRRPYPVSAADRNQLGRFMRDHGEYLEAFAAICDRYLSDRRQFVIDRSNGHTLTWLVTRGLATYGGTPRESAEQYATRVRREHEARKKLYSRPARAPEMRALISSLAEKKQANL